MNSKEKKLEKENELIAKLGEKGFLEMRIAKIKLYKKISIAFTILIFFVSLIVLYFISKQDTVSTILYVALAFMVLNMALSMFSLKTIVDLGKQYNEELQEEIKKENKKESKTKIKES